ncbi:MAG TPA: protoheme IX farnesyltransferase, partial [Longimicrobiales bacterium]|nr:protoheme IX farnesyltransferase [Longimicrobiales bacterium]
AATLAGTLAATAGALALNQYIERAEDAVMRRTRGRPLPSGRLRPREALWFGLGLTLGGVLLLLLFVDWRPAVLTAASAAAYNLVYTPLKSRSYFATAAGAVPGALPALIGWTAARPDVTWGAVVLFGIAYLWQIPHVFALAWMLKDDYLRAGFLYMIPPTDPDGRVVALQMVSYATLLIPVSLMPSVLGLTGPVFFGGALVLGLLLWGCTAAATVGMTRAAARRVFLGSLLYHPVLMLLMVVDAAPA